MWWAIFACYTALLILVCAAGWRIGKNSEGDYSGIFFYLISSCLSVYSTSILTKFTPWHCLPWTLKIAYNQPTNLPTENPDNSTSGVYQSLLMHFAMCAYIIIRFPSLIIAATHVPLPLDQLTRNTKPVVVRAGFHAIPLLLLMDRWKR